MGWLSICGDDVGCEVECRLVNGGWIVFERVKIDEDIRSRLEGVLDREGSRFGIECIRDRDGKVINEMGLWILVYDRGIKLGDGRDV